MTKIITEPQNMLYLKWSHARNSSGTAGTFLKAESNLDGQKLYYKISNYDSQRGIIGHECINEIIVDRLLTILGVEHLEYKLINANITIDGQRYNTYLCESKDFKAPGESKVALDDYYRVNTFPGESCYDFCVRMGWKEYIDTMIAVDYIILNRDRHGANVEILRSARKQTLRIAPLFDHGVSLLYSCINGEQVAKFDILEDRLCNNFIGSKSCYENLKMIETKDRIFKNKLEVAHKEYLFENLEDCLDVQLKEKIWDMIYERYKIFEKM